MVHEGPFNSDRKRMSTIVRLEDGKEYCFMKGASEYMLGVSNKFHSLQDNQILQLDDSLNKKLEESINGFAIQALRTIGLCYKEVDSSQLDFEDTNDHGVWKHEEGDFTLIGIAGIKDIIRDSVPKSIRKCHMAGIDIKMVTGDNKVTARAIAEEINLINDKNREKAIVMEGPDFYK